MDSRRCTWCGGWYFEATCEHCENAIVDEARNAAHDGRSPRMVNPTIELPRSTLTKAQSVTIDVLMAQPEFRELVEPMAKILQDAYKTKETDHG